MASLKHSLKRGHERVNASLKRLREQRYDELGLIVLMADVDGWVMVRRPGAAPRAMTKKWWESLSLVPITPAGRAALEPKP